MNDGIAAAIAAQSLAASRLPLRIPLSSGRIAAVDVPRDATAEELSDLAAILLGPVRAQCSANRGEGNRPHIIVPS